jgi:signal recognition particle subunit SRP72
LASKVYRFLQSEAACVADNEEAGEIATNALANAAANVTYCGSIGGCVDVGDDEDAVMERVDGVGDYNYDLLRNYALLHLLQATSAADLHRVIKLLRQAEEGAQIAFEEEEGELTEVEIENELAPIRADIATAQQLLGDRQSASRTYFELIKSDDPALQFVARHNLAVLSSSTNPSAAAKQMPDLSDESVSSKLTPAQLRTILFNRALLALANKKHDDARKALAALKTAVVGDGAKKARRKGAGASAAAALARQVPSAPPARKNVDVALWSSQVALVESELLRAERKTGEAAAALQAAIDDLETVERPLKKGSSEIEAVQFGIAALALHKLEVERQSALQLQAESSEEDDDDEEEEGGASSLFDPIELLSNLPEAIKTRPAILGALSSLYDQAGQHKKCTEIIDMLSSSVISSGGSSDVQSAKIKSSQYIKTGRYEDAVETIRTVLDGNADLSEEMHMELTARLVQALSYVNPTEAQELVSSLEGGGASILLDGDELESRETPRLGKGSGVPVSANTGGGTGGESVEKNAKRQAILHRRSRKREAYLQKLEDEGRYNPDKPSKPDPERWIPKAQRSYNRRGRRGRQRFVGAQGGGTGAGAERDAAKLDAAARAAAKREGIAFGPSTVSTAHMEVASGSTRRKGGRR